MATELLMPRQGNTVESCLILEWKKKEGDSVKTGEVVCEVETDKATFEVEASADGTLLKFFYQEGDDVPVLTPIAVIGTPGEDISGFGGKPSERPAVPGLEQSPAANAVFIEDTTAPATAHRRISPRAKNLAEARGIDYAGIIGTGAGGRIIERDIAAFLKDREPSAATAFDRLITSGLKAPVSGTGIGGGEQIAAVPRAGGVTASAAGFPGPVKEIPVKGVRKLIADRMLQSISTSAQLTLNASADATALLAYRQRLKSSPEELGLTGITINDLVLYAVSRILPAYRYMNAHFLGDRIIEFENIHLGFAVDTPRGLMVPVIRNVNLLSLKEISEESRRLSSACRKGNINPDALKGGTFTVTNLGVLGIESFTPVLNIPEVAILGVCNISPRPVMKDEEVKFVPHLGLVLTINHQAVDGVPGAKFLQALSHALANFDLLLAG
ncbi:MAG: dihydrolipoamide acetyltransferase family protein [Spirochaetota bacterium]